MGASPASPPAGYIKAWVVERRTLRQAGCLARALGKLRYGFGSGLHPSGVSPPAVAGGVAGSGTPLPPASSPRPTPRQADPPAAVVSRRYLGDVRFVAKLWRFGSSGRRVMPTLGAYPLLFVGAMSPRMPGKDAGLN